MCSAPPSTKPAAPIRRRSATRSWPPRATQAQRANIISTSSATACTATISCATKKAPWSSTSTSSSTNDFPGAAPAVTGTAPPSRELSMDFVLQLLFQGIAIGSVYALVALGFVLIFRATNVVNFAQGEFSMVAAFLMVVCAVDLGWPYWLSFLIALAGMAFLGAVFNLGVYYPLRHRTYLPVIISTIGASILMTNSTLAIYG